MMLTRNLASKLASTVSGTTGAAMAAVFALSVLVVQPAVAVDVGSPSPVPSLFAADDGAELFEPSGVVLSMEIWDAIGSFTDTTFGFYYADDPTELIPIFEPDDIAPPVQSAAVDFSGGRVWDGDEFSVQNTFTPKDEFIGFYIDSDALGTIYSEGALNASAADQVGTYALLVDPSIYLLGFDSDVDKRLAIEIVSGVTPVADQRPGSAVPEPTAAASFSVGLLVIGAALRRRLR